MKLLSILVLLIFRLGRVIQEIQISTINPTFISIGGPRRNILFVTTASVSINFDTTAIGAPVPKPGGNLFMVHGIARGYAPNKPQV